MITYKIIRNNIVDTLYKKLSNLRKVTIKRSIKREEFIL